MSCASHPSLALRRIAMLSGHSCPLAPWEIGNTFIPPHAEAKDIVAGYIVVEANNLAHTVALAKGCPILEVGGSLEVRPVQKLEM
jgi:YCII-related domain-containing protein